MLDIRSFDHVRQTRLRLLLEHWLAARGDALVPQRRSIDPVRFPSVLTQIAVFHIAPEGAIQFRLAGEEIHRLYGQERLRGRFLHDVVPDSTHQIFAPILRSVAAGPAVIHGAGRLVVRGREIGSESLLLPTAEGPETNGVLHAVLFSARLGDEPHHADFGARIEQTITPLAAPAGATILRRRSIVIPPPQSGGRLRPP